MIIESNHLDNESEQKEIFLNIVSVVFGIRNIDSRMNTPISLASTKERVEQGLSNKENQQFLKMFLLTLLNKKEAVSKIRFNQLRGGYSSLYKLGAFFLDKECKKKIFGYKKRYLLWGLDINKFVI